VFCLAAAAAGAAALAPGGCPAAWAVTARAPVPPDTVGYYVEPLPYRIAPGDELFIDYGLILDKQPITATATVRPDGVVTLPRVGDLRMAGLTTGDADTMLARMYADVYVNPRITVAVRQVAGNLVHVLGQVKNPGSYPMTPNATALQAIAQAGGFMDNAARGDVVVIRRSGPDEIWVRKLNLRKVYSGRVAAADMMLRRYDIVFVNRSAVGNVTAFVSQILAPVISVGDAYYRGWETLNMGRLFPRIVANPASAAPSQ
jgi:protein involved in polysaccharide export with SLBB domain